MGTTASAGTVIEGKYRLERELGAGGMGTVFLATQLMVDRPVAVKVLHPSHLNHNEVRARFEVEAKAIGRLNHPNVITLYDFGFSPELDAFYTVIEYIDGVPLDHKLDDRLHIREIVAIVRQIALALDHAHHIGILHRDLKPENVMLARLSDGTDHVKVLDFGIARIVKGSGAEEEKENVRITKAGEVFGTPAYMSPEQARSVRQLGPTADLYSLGVMFYELVAGSLPFFAQSAFDLLMMHVTKPVPPIRRLDVPEEICSIIYRMLEKAPEDRFQSGREVVAALDRVPLPEVSDEDLDEFEGGEPTAVSAPPRASSPTIGTPPPMGPVAVGRPQAAPSPAAMAIAKEPTERMTAQGASGPEAGHRHPTMTLGEDGRQFTTGVMEDVDTRRGIIGIVVGLLAFVALVSFLVYAALVDNSVGSAVAEPAEGTEPDVADEEIEFEELEEPEAAPATVAENAEEDPAAVTPPVRDLGEEVAEELPPEAIADSMPLEEEKAEEQRPEAKPKPKPKPKRRTKTKSKPQKKPVFERISITDESEPRFERSRLD